MQGSGSSAMKAILSILAVVCVALIVVVAVKSINNYKDDLAENAPGYNEFENDLTPSGGDIIVSDDGTVELDSIPSNADAAPDAAPDPTVPAA